MADWCLVTRQSPETYLSLTREQRQAFLDIIAEARR